MNKPIDMVLHCPRPGCAGEMLPGVAIGQTLTGVPDFLGGEVVTLSPGGPGYLMTCLKCNACGFSMTWQPHPAGDVIGPCVCGSWPGGKCLKCPRVA